MNVNLTPELERMVQAKVASGLYNNQSEVVREALRLLAEQDRLRQSSTAHLRAALAAGVEQADRGELLDGSAVIAELRQFLRARRDGKKDPRVKLPIVRLRDASLRKVARTHRRSGGKDVCFSHSRDAAERR